MNYEDAMYNCLLRRATLVAFEEKSELNKYWYNSSYFQNAFETGLVVSSDFLALSKIKPHGFTIHAKFIKKLLLCQPYLRIVGLSQS
jgi:hypothetical protein